MVQRNVLAMSGRAVEAAGDCSTCCSTRPARSPSATGMATESSRWPASPRTNWPRRRCCRAWPTRRPRAARSSSWRSGIAGRPPGPRRGELVPFTAQTRMSGVDCDGRRIRKGAADAVRAWVRTPAARSRPSSTPSSTASPQRRHAAGGGRRRPGPRCDPPQGHGQAGHARAVRAAARHGHPHRDDHRRQPAHRQGHRGRGRRRRLPGRGHAGGQAGADPPRAARRAHGRDDRRRHQRRARARAGRRRAWR